MELRLNKKIIYDLSSNATVYYEGEELYKGKKVINSKFEYNKDSREQTYFGDICVGSRIYKTQVDFDKDGEVLNHVCTCNSIWRGACKHVIANMLYILQVKNKHIIAEQNSRISEELLNKFKSKILSDFGNIQSMNSHKNVILVPELVFAKRKCYLNLSIGETRKYKIRNINDFYQLTKKNEVYKYGKEFVFDHNINSYNTQSKKLVNLIVNEIDFQNSVKENLYIRKNDDDSKELFLSERAINDFLNLYKNERIDILANNYSYLNVLVSLEKPNLLIEIKKDKDKTFFTLNRYPILTMRAKGNIYLFFEEEICKTSLEDFEIIKTLIEAGNFTEDKTVTFSGLDSIRFDSIVVPVLKKIGLISDTSIANEDLEIINRFYFDYKNETITCKGIVFLNDFEMDVTKNENAFVDEKEFLQNILRKMNFERKEDVFVLKRPEYIYNFLTTGLLKLQKVGDVFVSKDFESKSKIPPYPKINVHIRMENNLLELDFDCLDYSLEELIETMDKYIENREYVRLKNGKFINTNNENFREIYKTFSAIDISKKSIENNKITLGKYEAFYIDEVFNDETLYTFEKDLGFKRLVNDVKNYTELEMEIPKNLTSVLRDYQKKGFKWLKTLSHYNMGGILADDMGLGKTIQAISFLVSEKLDGKTETSIIVCPTSLIYNWQKEFEKFGKELSVEIIAGLPEKRQELVENSKADVFITTYDILKRDLDFYDNKKFNVIFADEAQNIKNPLTQNSKSIKKINSRCNFALTGTPIENSLTELWSIFDFALPGYLKTLSKFNNEFAKPIVKDKDLNSTNKLKNKINPFILRRLKSDVLLELPEKIEKNVYADMTSEQRKLYTAYLYEARREFENIKTEGSINRNKIKILSTLTRLRQICCDPSMFLENYNGGSGKLEITLETIKELLESNHRILLFSQFTSMLSIIKEELNKNKINYFYLDGSVSSLKRMEMTENFNDGKREVFLISLKAGGTGLNLTGADSVIHYDPWWNPSIMTQATDRAHRIGQKKVVSVFNIVAKNSIEEKIIELQNMKKELIDSVLEEGATFINQIDNEELESLFLD